MPNMGGGTIILGGGGMQGGFPEPSAFGPGPGMGGGPSLEPGPAAAQPKRSAPAVSEVDEDFDDEVEDEVTPARDQARSQRGGPSLGPSGGRRRKPGRHADEDGAGKTTKLSTKERIKALKARKAAAEAAGEVDELDEMEEEELEIAEEEAEEEAQTIRLVKKPAEPEPPQQVDLVTIAALGPWLERGVRRLGRKRVKSILEVYTSMGGLNPAQRDVLTQLVSMDETEAAPQPASIQDVVGYLVELDDFMWRGKQDWRRAALMSMLANSRDLLDASA